MPESTAPSRHLLFVTTVFPTPWDPHKGPAMVSLVSALRAEGCRVTVVAPVPWTARLRGHRSVDVTGAEYPTYWYTPGVLRHRYHEMLGWSLDATLSRIAKERQPPEAVLAFWAHPDGAVAVAYGAKHGVPAGVIAAGSDVLLLPAEPRRREVVSRTLQRADHIFAVGGEIARRSVALGASAERVTTFVQGVDRQRFAPGDRADARRRLGIPADGPLLLWVGNMVEVKAAERVLLAARALVAHVPGLRVAMVGRGPVEPELRRVAAESGALAERVVFPGPVASAALPSWYQAANVMVLPSRSEGVPNVLLEAMATGLPFVASDVGSIADLLPFGPSRVTAQGNVEALTEAIAAVLDQSSDAPLPPKAYDITDGARDILRHLQLERP